MLTTEHRPKLNEHSEHLDARNYLSSEFNTDMCPTFVFIHLTRIMMFNGSIIGKGVRNYNYILFCPSKSQTLRSAFDIHNYHYYVP